MSKKNLRSDPVSDDESLDHDAQSGSEEEVEEKQMKNVKKKVEESDDEEDEDDDDEDDEEEDDDEDDDEEEDDYEPQLKYQRLGGSLPKDIFGIEGNYASALTVGDKVR